MMNLDGMDRTVDKLIMITSKRLRSMRTKEITDIQTAEYYGLMKDIDWYHRVKSAVLDAKGGSAMAIERIYRLLDERVEDQIKLTDEKIDSLRKLGAGQLAGTPEAETHSKRGEMPATMTESDKDFLRSCGIKGEIWPL